jgi:hypothetical protein
METLPVLRARDPQQPRHVVLGTAAKPRPSDSSREESAPGPPSESRLGHARTPRRLGTSTSPTCGSLRRLAARAIRERRVAPAGHLLRVRVRDRAEMVTVENLTASQSACRAQTTSKAGVRSVWRPQVARVWAIAFEPLAAASAREARWAAESKRCMSHTEALSIVTSGHPVGAVPDQRHREPRIRRGGKETRCDDGPLVEPHQEF